MAQIATGCAGRDAELRLIGFPRLADANADVKREWGHSAVDGDHLSMDDRIKRASNGQGRGRLSNDDILTSVTESGHVLRVECQSDCAYRVYIGRNVGQGSA